MLKESIVGIAIICKEGSKKALESADLVVIDIKIAL